MPEESNIEKALRVFSQLEEAESRLQDPDTQGVARDLMETVKGSAVKILTGIVEEPGISEELQEVIDKEADDLSFAASTGLVDQESIDNARESLSARHASILRLAAWSSGILSIDVPSTVTADLIPEQDLKEQLRLEELLSQPVEELAESLVGMRISYGIGKTGVITKVRPQDAEFNAKWQNDPIFGEQRVDAMIRKERGGVPLLYIRAGEPDDTSCICIMSAEIDGEVYKKPSHVTKALGIKQPSNANISLKDDTLYILPTND